MCKAMSSSGVDSERARRVSVRPVISASASLARFERHRTGLGARPVLDPEDGQKPVAQELQDLAAARV